MLFFSRFCSSLLNFEFFIFEVILGYKGCSPTVPTAAGERRRYGHFEMFGGDLPSSNKHSPCFIKSGMLCYALIPCLSPRVLLWDSPDTARNRHIKNPYCGDSALLPFLRVILQSPLFRLHVILPFSFPSFLLHSVFLSVLIITAVNPPHWRGRTQQRREIQLVDEHTTRRRRKDKRAAVIDLNLPKIGRTEKQRKRGNS